MYKIKQGKGLLSPAIISQWLVLERSVQRGVSSQVRAMKEKSRAYIGQDVYTGRPGRLPDVECCHLVFVWLYIIPTECWSNVDHSQTNTCIIFLTQMNLIDMHVTDRDSVTSYVTLTVRLFSILLVSSRSPILLTFLSHTLCNVPRSTIRCMMVETSKH